MTNGIQTLKKTVTGNLTVVNMLCPTFKNFEDSCVSRMFVKKAD